MSLKLRKKDIKAGYSLKGMPPFSYKKQIWHVYKDKKRVDGFLFKKNAIKYIRKNVDGKVKLK